MEGDTVLVAAGTYSPSTNSEVFPIEMASGIHLIGSGKDISIIDAQQTSRVITMDDCDNNTISDLTLTGGLAVGSITDNHGGGMLLYYSNPILTHVTISNNTASWYGGGMELYYSDPMLTHVTILNNTAGQGGGMILYSSNPILTHVTISNNTAVNNGGGGMHLNSCNPILTHVTISNNTAVNNGGGMDLINSYPMLTHVTISHNTAEYGGGMGLYSSNPILTNSIIWGNSPESISSGTEQPIIAYSDIEAENIWTGEGNINSDPLFTDPENDDYTLQPSSPCIDTGTIIEGMEYCGEAPDMGAYEYCEEEFISGDVTQDGLINVLDVVLLVDWILNGTSLTDLETMIADMSGDGLVNVLDIVALVDTILNP